MYGYNETRKCRSTGSSACASAFKFRQLLEQHETFGSSARRDGNLEVDAEQTNIT
jgi:hypothetical protein